jgi:DNA-binding NarL/FixJ family response regulator/signal transduction histidine kinase
MPSRAADEPQNPPGADGTGANSVPVPRFALPEVVGVAMQAEEIAQIVQKSVEEMMTGFHCTRLVALSYSPREGLIRGVTAAGFEAPTLRELLLPISEFPLAERALRTRQVLVMPDTAALSEGISPYFQGEIIVVPLLLGDRALAILIGQLAPGVAARSAAWQARAQEVAARAALVVELERLASAYQDGLQLRESSRVVAAAILEGRPLSEIAEIITEIVSQRLRVDRVALFLRDAAGRIRPAALRNVSAEHGDAIARLPRPGPMMTRAMATGLPYYARRAQEDPQIGSDLRELFQREGITSLLVAMLQHEDAVKGALVVYPEQERLFTPAEIALFRSWADQATLAVAMTQQLEQQRDIAMIEERNRLAREMHDTVAQALAGLVFQLETAQTLLQSDDREAALEMLAASRTQAKKALEDTRRAVQGLAPEALERLSPAQAIAEETRRFEAEEGIPTAFILTGEEQILLSEQRTALLRIAQEALTNARKYARANRVRVGLQYGPDSVTLLIEDDGVGFDLAAQDPSTLEGGYGLFGMQERARLLYGEVQIESTPGWGTRIRAVLPHRPASPIGANAGALETSPPLANTLSDPRVETRPLPEPGSLPRRGAGEPSRSAPVRVLVADDHAITREGIRAMLEASGEIVVAGEAGDGAEAVEKARLLQPDVVLMDLQMPRVDGLEGLRRLHAEQPSLPVVILTTFQTDASVTEALSAGARGYLLKDTEPAHLIAAIRAAQRGEALLSPTVTERLSSLASGQVSKPAEDLNERELEILQLLAQGARNKEIAARLFLSTKTVEYHLSNLFHKLSVSNRTEAARAAIERGLVIPESRK